MTQPHSHANPYDGVLGGGTAPAAGLVLGGLAGAKRRLEQAIDPADRVTALWQASRYGSEAVEVLSTALHDRALVVQRAAYHLLRSHPDPAARQALRHYDRYQLFECLQVLTGHSDGVTAVAASADGKIAISAGRDAQLRVWDLRYAAERFVIHEPRFVYGIAIDQDNHTFTAKLSDRTYKAWDLRVGEAIELEEFPTRSIASVTTSARTHGRYLVSGSQNLIRIWNLTQGREVCVLRGHQSLVTSVSLAARRPILVSGSEDRTVRVWGVGR